MVFTWNEAKAEANLWKHKVSFAEAATVFDDPDLVLLNDREHSEHEARVVAIGHASRSGFLFVVHTYREDANTEIIHIISARAADRKERLIYEQAQR